MFWRTILERMKRAHSMLRVYRNNFIIAKIKMKSTIQFSEEYL